MYCNYFSASVQIDYAAYQQQIKDGDVEAGSGADELSLDWEEMFIGTVNNFSYPSGMVGYPNGGRSFGDIAGNSIQVRNY